MSNLTLILSIALIVLLLYACQSGKVQGDIHPDIPALPLSQSENLSLQQLPHITTIQYAPDGNIHAIGRRPEDTTMPNRLHKYLFIYTPNFELIEQRLITKDKNFVAIVDPQSNVYCSKSGSAMMKYSYPDYKASQLEFHPIATRLNEIANRELRSSKNTPNYKEYKRLKKEGKEDEIDANRKEVAKALQQCYEQHLDLDAIDYGVYHSGKYVFFMKNGKQYRLNSYQGMNGKASLSSFLKKQSKIIIYRHHNRDDKGRSIANMLLLEQHKKKGINLQDRLVQIDYAVSEKKTTFENWPNTGYTKAFYYYQLNFNQATATFKIEQNVKSKNKIEVIGQEEAPVCFLRGNEWYVVQPI